MGRSGTNGNHRRHSLFGVSACLLGAAMFVLFAVVMGLYVLQFNDRIAAPQDEGIALLMLVSGMVLPVPVHLFAALLGAVGLFAGKRKRTFPIAAIVANLVFGTISLLPWLYLMFAGLGRV